MCRIRKVLAVMMLSLIVLAGCGQSEEQQGSSLTIAKGGEISHHIVGSFDQMYYDVQELRTLADERVAEYCTEHGAESVVLKELEEKDGKVSIRMEYGSVEDYVSFNNRGLFAGTVTDAGNAGYELDQVALVSMDNKPYEPGDIEGIDDLHIAVVETAPDEQLTIQVPGRIQYINQSAGGMAELTADGKKSVLIKGHGMTEIEDGAEQTGVLSYIIYQ